MTDFEEELRALINRHSKENASNTPDFILAKYMCDCLTVMNTVIYERSRWYARWDGPVKEVKE